MEHIFSPPTINAPEYPPGKTVDHSGQTTNASNWECHSYPDPPTSCQGANTRAENSTHASYRAAGQITDTLVHGCLVSPS